jgi:membrane peptidoglycan carboxypeptidase
LQYALNVKDKDGKMIFSNPCIDSATPCGGSRKLDARIAYQITNILMDNIARSPAFGLHSVLDIPKHQVAVKTGTTNLLRDNWTDGYTSDRVVVVWVGNNDNTPMNQSLTSGITGASPIWKRTMTMVLEKNIAVKGDVQPPLDFAIPGGVVSKPCYFNRVEYFKLGINLDSVCRQNLISPTPDPLQSNQ